MTSSLTSGGRRIGPPERQPGFRLQVARAHSNQLHRPSWKAALVDVSCIPHFKDLAGGNLDECCLNGASQEPSWNAASQAVKMRPVMRCRKSVHARPGVASGSNGGLLF